PARARSPRAPSRRQHRRAGAPRRSGLDRPPPRSGQHLPGGRERDRLPHRRRYRHRLQGAMMAAAIIVLIIVVVLVVVLIVQSVTLVPQAQAAVIERLGRYSRTISGQLTFLVPFVDRVRERVDLRERVVSFPPQPVITQDNLTLSIDTVVYFQVTNSHSAVYEINDYIE